MVSNAKEDFPEPESPVKTTNSPLGMSTDIFFKLCSLAPLIFIYFVSIIISINMFEQFEHTFVTVYNLF